MTFLSLVPSAKPPQQAQAFLGEPRPPRIERPRPTASTLEQALAQLQDTQRALADRDEKINALEKSVPTDSLTGLLNRTGLMTALRRELALARRSGKSAGLLVLIDIDDFRQVNDLYGSDVGDFYLQSFGAILINEIRTSDHVARLEGDTFAVVLPQIAMRAAGPRLEALARTINSRVMHSRAHAIPLKASLGFAVLSETETPDSLLLIAERNLTASKARRKMGMAG